MKNTIINNIEALLLGSGRPLRLSEIRTILESHGIKIELSSIKQSINLLEERYSESSLELTEVASGYRIQIKKNHSSCLAYLWNEKTPRISLT